MANLEWDTSSGWDLPSHFDMPSAREIELDLALGSDSWRSLLVSDKPSPAPAPAGSHAIVIGGSMAGLLAARVLADRFDRVTIVDRDRLPDEARFRDGVPQSRHLHALLKRGLSVLEELFPGLESELLAAGAVRLTGRDFLRLSAAGWARRFEGPPLIAATRELIEWSVRSRTLQHPKVSVLHEQEIVGLLMASDKPAITGVQTRTRGAHRHQALTAPMYGDLVVDASGRNSRAPEWLEAIGYSKPQETLIDSFLGYASCVFAPPPGFKADWKVLMLGDKPTTMPRSGALFPIEGDRWMVTLAGYGRDYPPTNMGGFMEFARSLRSEILYQTIKDARPLSRISGFRSTLNQRRHFEALTSWPERFVVVGDAACAFNPVYGQGMSVAAMTAVALKRGLEEHIQRVGSADLTGFARGMQRTVAKASQGAWVIATGADARYPTTEGRQPRFVDRAMHAYLDRVIQVSMQDATVNEAFLRVVHLLDAPPALFRPAVALRALVGVRQPIADPPIGERQAVLRPVNA
ncbi:MAG TPA: FAD-dependent monooxygenase [Candidatus Dormibacteraeota bacterium]